MRVHRLAAISAVLVLFFGLLGATVEPAEGPTTVVVVRHAERADVADRDPPLSAEGAARAEALAEALADAGVSAIYATPYRRTRDTAAPLARRLGLEIRETAVEGGIEAHAREVARRAAAENPGGVALVVGHSNTVPAIVSALTGLEIPALSEDAYGDLFIVQVQAAGRARLIRARFGR